MPPRTDFEIRPSTAGTVQVLGLSGVLDDIAGPALERAVHALPQQLASRVVLDLSQLRYASSAGIAAFIALHRRLKAGGGILVLAQPSEALAEMLLTLHLASLIPVHASIDAGVLAAYGS